MLLIKYKQLFYVSLCLQGGEPDIETTAKRVLNDFQRGKLPYFVKPPPLEDDEEEEGEAGPSKKSLPNEESLEQGLVHAFEGSGNVSQAIEESMEVSFIAVWIH